MKQDTVVTQSNREQLIKLIERSTRDLHQRVDMQHYVLLCIMGQIKDGCPVDLRSLVDCPHRRLLRQVLAETIEILEETKKAFKSKRLEGLRKRLLYVLMETA
jgi:RNAse (barnase) inhibitor barstar